MRHLKSQFEQLEGYFKAHDKDNMEDPQSKIYKSFISNRIFEYINRYYNEEIVETLKLTHRLLLNEASSLKSTHDKIEVVIVIE